MRSFQPVMMVSLEEKEHLRETEAELCAAAYERQRRREAEAHQAAKEKARLVAGESIARLLGGFARLKVYKRTVERARVSLNKERQSQEEQDGCAAEEERERAVAVLREKKLEVERRELEFSAAGDLWGSRTSDVEHWAFRVPKANSTLFGDDLEQVRK